MLECASSGCPLSHQISSFLAPALRHSQIDWRPSKYHYASSTEIYVEFPAFDGAVHLLNIPNLFVRRVKQGFSLSRAPEEVFDQRTIEPMMPIDYPMPTPGRRAGDAPADVLDFIRPVKYQQNCNNYGSGFDCKINILSSEHYCAPNAISGCIPVAFALLMSSWKRSGFFGASAIWTGSTCWDIDWPSYLEQANPSQCPLVESTIWKLHRLMGTNSDGGTNPSLTSRGKAIFLDYGLRNLGMRFSSRRNDRFEFAVSVVHAGQPLLWTAEGTWFPGKGPAGHGVVAYGYQRSDRMLLVTLGWGSYFSDKYINFDQYRENTCFFMSVIG
jgi:hypothetical protein